VHVWRRARELTQTGYTEFTEVAVLLNDMTWADSTRIVAAGVVESPQPVPARRQQSLQAAMAARVDAARNEKGPSDVGEFSVAETRAGM